MKCSLYALLVLLCLSCSPEKKLNRFLAKHPELTAKDTITVHDTVYVAGDTLREAVTFRDTITIENERQVIRIVRVPTGSPCDTALINARIEGMVKADTVFTEKQVIVEKVAPIRVEKVEPAWMWILIGLLLAVIGYLLVKLLWK